MATFKIIADLALNASNSIEHVADRDTDHVRFYRPTLNEGWIFDMCRAAHGDFLPEDRRYEMIVEALDLLMNSMTDEDEEMPQYEIYNAIADGGFEPDVYNAGRFAWLASNLNRSYYVEDAIEEYGLEIGKDKTSLSDAIAAGMILEFQEVAQAVATALYDAAQALEEATA